MRGFTYSLFFLLALGDLLAQPGGSNGKGLDSLREKLTKDSLHIYRFKKFRPYLSIDNRNSFIRSAPVNFRGLQLGFIYKEKHTIGLGGYRITQNSQRPVKTRDKTNRIVNQYLRLNYTTLFYEYSLIDKRYYEISIPLEAGLGNASIRLVDSLTGTTLRNENLPIIPLGAGLQLAIKPFRWVGLSTMGGYRYVNEKGRNLNFSGWYYSIGLWIDLRQIYRDIRFYGFVRKRYRREAQKLRTD